MVQKAERKPSPRQKLLAAADELFYNEGVHAVTIDRVIDKASVARGSLYYNFDGKDDLIREYLLGRHAAWTARIEQALEEAKDPGAKILTVFDALGTLFAEPSYRGCSFMNAVAEAPTDGPEIKAAATYRSWLHELFGDLVAALNVRHPQELTDQLIVLYDGAVTAAQMDKSPHSAATARTLASMAVESSTSRSQPAQLAV